MEIKKKITIGISGHIHTDQRMKRIAGSLSKNGASISLYYREHFKFKPVKTADQLPFTTIGMRILVNNGILFYAFLNWHLFWKLLFKKTDIYYAVDADTLPAFTMLSILKGKPLFYDAHEYFCEVPELQNSRLKKKVWDIITRIGVKRASKCLTVGPMLAKELEKRYHKAFAVVRNTTKLADHLNRDAPLPFTLPDKPIILYQGALNKGRELELLINAMPELPEFHCLLAGEGDLSERLREQAKSMNNVQFAGLLSPDTLKTLTPQCFAGYNLLDTEGSLSYYFSLSNKYFDYIHAGIPSISSRLPEYEALNDSNGCGVCIENTKEELIKTLKNWLADTELYQKFRENTNIARKVCQWETDEAALLALFRP